MSPKDLLNAFDTFTDSPGGVVRLRELVLQLAARGSLVPQDPEDVSATELLAHIEIVKGRLVEAKEVRKPKPLPSIEESEMIHELPRGWVWVRLGQIADYNGRQKIDSDSIDSATWLLDLEDIEKTTSRLLTRKSAGDRKSKSSKSTFHRGDVLYGKLRPYLDKVLVAEESGVCTTEIVPITPYGGLIDSYWLRWTLKRPDFIEHVNTLSYGVKMPRLGTGDAISSVHPMPPLNEQHRIVAKVEELMALLDELEQARDERDAHRTAFRDSALSALQNVEDSEAVKAAWSRIATNLADCITDPADIAPLRQTILQLAVRGRLVPLDPNDEPAIELLKEIEKEKADLILSKKIRKQKPLPAIDESEMIHELPRGWVWVRLGQIADYNGRQKIDSDSIDSATWLLDLEDIEKTTSRLLTRKSAGDRKSKSSKSTFHRGDVLYGKLRPYLDKVLVAEESGVCTTEIVPITPYGGLIDSYWLRWTLKRPDFIEHVNTLSYGVKMPRLGTGDAISSVHPMPPLNEQHRIVAKVEELMAICDELEQRLIEAKTHQSAFAAAAVHHLDLAQETQPV